MTVLLLPILKTSAKSVQTSAVVCTDYTCSLHRLRRVLNLGARKHRNKYDVLTEVFTRKYLHVYAYLLDIRIIKILLFKIWCGTQYRFYLWKIYIARKLYI